MKRVMIACDVTNLYTRVQHKHGAGKKIAYKKIYDFAAERGEIVYAFAYGSLIQEMSRPFLDYLRRHGFVPKMKKAHAIGGTDFRKANYGVELSIDVVSRIDQFDTLVLCTADSDFSPLAQFVLEQGKSVIILGAMIPTEMIAHATIACELPESFLYER